MRKRITAVLSILICIMMVFSCTSCTQSGDNSEMQKSTDNSVIITYGSQKGDLIVDPPETRFRTESYAEYTNFVQTTELPSHFVTYEQGIDLIGTFHWFMETGDPDTYNVISYKVVDETGNVITASVRTAEKAYKLDEYGYTHIEILPDTNNTRTADVTERSYYTHEGITYVYSKEGKLISLIWLADDLQLYVRFQGMSGYPNNNRTFFGRLLDLDTAPAAVAEFNAAVRAG